MSRSSMIWIWIQTWCWWSKREPKLNLIRTRSILTEQWFTPRVSSWRCTTRSHHKSQQCSAAPPGQHDGHCLHKTNRRNLLPLLMQGEPSIMVPSYQEESHSSPPHSISTQENTEADFFSRHRLQRWDFKLALSEYWRICQRLQVWPRLEGFLEQ